MDKPSQFDAVPYCKLNFHAAAPMKRNQSAVSIPPQ